MKRIFAISDLHVDYKQNLDWVGNLSDSDYKNDTVIIAGDITDNAILFSQTLETMLNKFEHVFFVPGNHDLWIRKNDVKNSLDKFHLLMEICEMLGVKTRPFIFNYNIENDNEKICIQPVFSWYVKPEEGDDSLFMPKPGEDETLSMWADNRAIKWPSLNGYRHSAEMLIHLSDWQKDLDEKIPMITFTHFLPRRELIFGNKKPEELRKKYKDPVPRFNFSRVAGTKLIDKQIRKLGSSVHVYGHQHRNRFIKIDGITYIAHGLGYPKERFWGGINDDEYFPRMIWDSENGFQKSTEF